MAILFYLLFFFTPLIVWPYTSEIFEFNKIIFVYAMTTIISATWIIKCIQFKKIIFRRTSLDIPIVLYLFISLLSTWLSIDPHTSFFGYYSRFNGGLLSIICYSILYWAFVSNLSSKQALYSIYYILSSFVLVSLYGIAQHFGIDKDIWVQDVQNRIFSTLGQPNWLAAVLVAVLPIVFNKFPNYLISILFFVTLLFTKSRSGMLGFVVASLIYWSIILYKNYKENIKLFLVLNSIFVVLFFVFKPPTNIVSTGPALESGGTESGQIRTIVWRGAIDIWKAYPVFGSGLETFAYIYPTYRPIEHNLVSEWDFVYNKAHNEYLNILATAGSVGFISYLILIVFSLLQIYKSKRFDLLAGYIGLIVTNFFGFSVVPTQLFLFLFPAIALKLNE